MGMFRKKAAAGKPGNSAGGASAGLCDICNATLDRTDGYWLPTKTIVISESFWRHQYALMEDVSRELDIDGPGPVMFADSVRQGARSDTPWHVCENCGEFFIFDRDEARSCAINGTDPEGNGPVEPGQCAMFAAIAWEQVFGQWPANFRQPDAVGSCGVCARKIYDGEYAGSMDKAAMDGLRDSGLIDGEPQSPPRPGTGTWMVCVSCVARIDARQQRANTAQPG